MLARVASTLTRQARHKAAINSRLSQLPLRCYPLLKSFSLLHADKPAMARATRKTTDAKGPIDTTKAHATGRKPRASEVKEEDVEESGSPPIEVKPNTSKKRGRQAVEDIPELPRKKRSSAKAIKTEDEVPVKTEPNPKAAIEAVETSKAEHKKKEKKANQYGLTPGESPFPGHKHPTSEECCEVKNLLAEVHGDIKAPDTIPAPSLTSAGCGEVPSVLDALVRTMLSANTSGANSTRSFQGLVQKFGLRKSGVGKGSVDWENVRLAPQKDVFEAIKSGGLADVKSKRIKEILDTVYEENQERSKELRAMKSEGGVGPPGAKVESDSDIKEEIERADENFLSLDHLHALSSEEAMEKLLSYPGVGPKTASCVLLFCMQRPSFAVDTHVWRITKWLNWVPKTASRETTFMHCDAKIPDELKYPLHYLLIKHGKTCGKCKAPGSRSAEGQKGKCPIDHLVKRSK